MAAIGQGDLCGAFLVAGLTCCEHLMAGPSPIWRYDGGVLDAGTEPRRSDSDSGEAAICFRA
jgi:hypothetical protein